MLTIRTIQDSKALLQLGPIWNELLVQSESNGIFLSWEWISTWMEVYGADFEPLVLVAEEDKQPCGIAPLVIRRGSNPVSHFSRTVVFIGQEVDVTPDYLDFIVLRGMESRVTRRFVHELEHGLGDRWDFIDFASHLQSSPNRHPLMHALHDAGIQLHVISEDAAPYAQLDGGWERFLQAKSPGFRKQYKNKLNRLHRAGNVRFLVGGQDLPVEAALEHIIRLNRDRWQEAGTSFRSDRYRRFHLQLCRRLASLDGVALLLMELDGEIVAGRYDYVYDDKLWCYQGGWSREHRELNLGDNMLAAIIRWGIERGLREYDFLGGADAYKNRWATGRRPIQELRGANHTGRAQLLSVLREGRWLLRGELRALGRRLFGERPAQSRAEPT